MANGEFPTWPLYASIYLGLVYLVTGIIYIFSGLGFLAILPSSNDFIGSIMLIIVGTVYLTSIPHLVNKEREGYAFTLVATTLALVLFVLHIIVLGTNALGSLLGLEDWIGWIVFDDLSPGLWLFGFVLIIITALKITGKLGGERGIFPLEG